MVHANHKKTKQEQTRQELLKRFSKKGIWRQRLRKHCFWFFWVVFAQSSLAAKRIFDITLAAFLLFLFFPVLGAIFLGMKLQGKKIKKVPRMGKWGEIFYEYSFCSPNSDNSFFGRLPILINILKGQVSFIGPRLATPDELSPSQRAVQMRLNVSPGLFCLWWIRKRLNIDYGVELEADAEYVESQSFKGDIGIALRVIPAILYGQGVSSAQDHITILGIPINNLTMSGAVDAIIKALDSQKGKQVCFVNADCANVSAKDAEYMKILQSCDMVLADGIGFKLAGKLLAKDIKQNVNGTDMFPFLCEKLAASGKGLFLLGGRPGVPEGVQDWLQRNYPELALKGCHHGYFSPDEEENVIKLIKDSGAALLLVAFGAPRQDKWIREHIERTGVKVAIGVGGLFDFYSGRISRAPLWMREIGMEWLYRFYQEPKRMWKRYFVGNFVFLFRVVMEKIFSKD